MKSFHFKGTLTAALVLIGLLFTIPACASSHAQAYVRFGPPAPVVERIIASPGPNFIWVPGFYRWDGHSYNWAPGHYVLSPRARRLGTRPFRLVLDWRAPALVVPLDGTRSSSDQRSFILEVLFSRPEGQRDIAI